MSEKQIDLDAMRAMAKEKPDTSGGVFSLSPQIILLQRALRATADEIEQLRKEVVRVRETWRADYESAITRSVDYKAAADRLYSEGEALRKERDALRGFIELETEQCPKSHVGGPCGQCTARRAALAAQGDKPHD